MQCLNVCTFVKNHPDHYMHTVINILQTVTPCKLINPINAIATRMHSLPCMPHCHAYPLPHMLSCHACPSATMHTPLPCTPPAMPPPCHVCPPAMHASPVDRMRDACENKTFPQLRLRMVNMPISVSQVSGVKFFKSLYY